MRKRTQIMVRLLPSALLLLCSLAWIRSYFRCDEPTVYLGSETMGPASHPGEVCFDYHHEAEPSARRWAFRWYSLPATLYDPMAAGWSGDPSNYIPKRYPLVNWNGFYALRREEPDIWYTAGVPYWSVAAILATIVAFQISRQLARRRTRAIRIERGCCGNCGYDLRGGSAVCPECGRPVPGQMRDKAGKI